MQSNPPFLWFNQDRIGDKGTVQGVWLSDGDAGLARQQPETWRAGFRGSQLLLRGHRFRGQARLITAVTRFRSVPGKDMQALHSPPLEVSPEASDKLCGVLGEALAE
ncbi:MAG: hypothetical protein ACKOJF_20000 [Planctomycetaceae bacterium]